MPARKARVYTRVRKIVSTCLSCHKRMKGSARLWLRRRPARAPVASARLCPGKGPVRAPAASTRLWLRRRLRSRPGRKRPAVAPATAPRPPRWQAPGCAPAKAPPATHPLGGPRPRCGARYAHAHIGKPAVPQGGIESLGGASGRPRPSLTQIFAKFGPRGI